ncbi:hypothetical protein RN001_000548 [Aquatica leii]|uniref:DUF4806 domain-containing protein n=1 Tax=Aquatica leii TaxID=1421715 RepID=A0AAN7PF21_9COLE|nr:hypothetical protein RN001_000548 [Aquatica leii]
MSSFSDSSSESNPYRNSDDSDIDPDYLEERGQDTIDRQLSDIKFEIKDLRKTLEKIENLLLSKTANNLEIGETEEDLFQNLPVSSVKELENFNIKLEDKQVLNRLVAFLYVLGREDAHKTIYVMLKKVMTNEVAQLFSTQGRKQKRAFLELKNLYGAITNKICLQRSRQIKKRGGGNADKNRGNFNNGAWGEPNRGGDWNNMAPNQGYDSGGDWGSEGGNLWDNQGGN